MCYSCATLGVILQPFIRSSGGPWWRSALQLGIGGPGLKPFGLPIWIGSVLAIAFLKDSRIRWRANKLSIDTDNNSNRLSGMGVHERLSAASKSMFTEMHIALDEALTGFCLDITQRLCVPKWIPWTDQDGRLWQVNKQGVLTQKNHIEKRYVSICQ
jgi:hypothetical protein